VIRLAEWDDNIPAAVTGRGWRTRFTCCCPWQRWHRCRNHTSMYPRTWWTNFHSRYLHTYRHIILSEQMRAHQPFYSSEIYKKEAERRCVFKLHLKACKVLDDGKMYCTQCQLPVQYDNDRLADGGLSVLIKLKAYFWITLLISYRTAVVDKRVIFCQSCCMP